MTLTERKFKALACTRAGSRAAGALTRAFNADNRPALLLILSRLSPKEAYLANYIDLILSRPVAFALGLRHHCQSKRLGAR